MAYPGAGSELGSKTRQAVHIPQGQSAPDSLPARWSGQNVTVFSGFLRGHSFSQEALAALDLDPSAFVAYGFSLHPDGKRFLTTITKFPYDIWMIEGFPPPHTRNWLDRFSDWLRGFGRPVPTRS